MGLASGCDKMCCAAWAACLVICEKPWSRAIRACDEEDALGEDTGDRDL